MAPLFGSKKKGKPAETGIPPTGEPVAPPPAPGMPEPVEFDEVEGAPAAATPPQTETLPAAVGSAQALRAVRSTQSRRPAPVARGPRPVATSSKNAKRTKSKLTTKQLAQRKYAARMRTVRKRAKAASGGKGRIAKRSGATKLRRKLGLNPGKATRKTGRKGSRKKR